MRYANPFRYSLNKKYANKPSVYKMIFGDKYFIWKGKSLIESLGHAATEIDRKLRLGTERNSIWVNIIDHIRNTGCSIMLIEVLMQSEDPGELIISEYDELQKSKNDEMCLNTAFEPHIAKWIPAEAIEKFNKHKQLNSNDICI